MIKKNFNFFSVMLLSSLIVGSYQLPLMENTLNKYGYENNINETFSQSKKLQQSVENIKISFSSYLEERVSNSVVSEPSIITNNRNIIKTDLNHFNNINNANSSNLVSQVHLKSNIPESTSHIPLAESNKKSNCLENCNVLMIGDSVMGDIDFSMKRLIKKELPNWKVIDGHKVSSGLTNQTYYDWPTTAKKLIEKYKPDYVFILLGTNDAQGMMFKGKSLSFSKELWINEYSNRVNQITETIKSSNASWYWIGLPVAKDKGFNGRLQVIRNIQSTQTKDNYFSVEHIFGKNDHSEPLNMKLRASDGIHLNSTGSDLVAKELIIKLKG